MLSQVNQSEDQSPKRDYQIRHLMKIIQVTEM